MNIVQVCEEERDKLLQQMSVTGFYTQAPNIIMFDATPWDINCGECESFADAVCGRIQDAESWWLPEPFSHCVVIYNNRYYDAECCQGVDTWCELPLVINQNKSRFEVLNQLKIKT